MMCVVAHSPPPRPHVCFGQTRHQAVVVAAPMPGGSDSDVGNVYTVVTMVVIMAMVVVAAVAALVTSVVALVAAYRTKIPNHFTMHTQHSRTA